MSWHAKPDGGYTLDSEEGKENALAIAEALGGWTEEAVSGVIGNIMNEGGLNPWRWEIGIDDSFPYSHRQVGYQDDSFTNLIIEDSGYYNAGSIIPAGIVGYGYGYGLFQYTGWEYYTNNATAKATEGYGANFSKTEVTPYSNPNDGYVQVRAFAENWLGKWQPNFGAWTSESDPIAFQHWQNVVNKYGTPTLEAFGQIDNIEDATVIMLICFERPRFLDVSINSRIASARQAYEVITGNVPPEPVTPEGGGTKSNFIFRLPNRRRRRIYRGY